MNSALKRSLPVTIIAVTGALLLGSAAHAQAPDPADIAAGARLFRQKGYCQACHGWAGDGRCYGLKQADIRSPKLQMPDPPATLQAREIDAIADFMFAKVIGQGPMDRAKCIDYWGSDVEACSEFAK